MREDYSAKGTAWEYFPHDHARSRAYRWGEDGIGGICDRHQRICFALALWNRRDPILKERLFGLNGNEGNHGEDVKEYYFYLDATPTHSYLKMLYKYPQAEFPYARLVEENRRRTKADPEFELIDTGIFDEDRYFDVFRRVCQSLGAKTFWCALPRGIAVRRRRRWICCRRFGFATPGAGDGIRSSAKLWRGADREGARIIGVEVAEYGRRWLLAEGAPELLFTGNETNMKRLFGVENLAPYVKDAFHEYLIRRPAGRRQSRRDGHQGRGALSAGNSRGRLDDAAAASHRSRSRRAAGRAVDRSARLSMRPSRRALPKPMSSTRSARRANAIRRPPARAAAGLRGLAVVQAVLPLRRADAGSKATPAFRRRPPERAHGPQPRVEAPLQRRRALHAGQMGVSVVCVVGHGVSLRGAGADRSRFRQGAAHSAAARVVHAPQRAVAGLRVGVRRRQSAGARLGGLARVQNREARPRLRGPRVSRARLSQAAAELHLVGQSQGPRRAERVRGRLPGPRQYRACSTVRRRCRPAAIWNNPTAPVGWACTA